jgi:predicted nuclease with TOPRIM domain
MGLLHPNNPVVQVEVLKERYRNLETRFSEQAESLKQAYIDIGRLEAKLDRASTDFHDMRVKLGVTEQKLTHADQSLRQSRQNTTGKDRQAKGRAFLADVLFFITSILVGVGASMLASTPPNPLGHTLIVLAIIVYLVGAVLTFLLG